MQYFALEPEVAGKLGDRTIVDRSTHPPTVQRLHYEFDGWLGDHLLESYPAFIVTDALASLLQSSGVTGYALADVEVSKSEQFDEIHPDRDLPKFRWLKVVGNPGMDDLGLSADHRLVASQRALDVLRSMRLENCDSEEYPTA